MAGDTYPLWIGVTIALSLVIVAGSFVAMAWMLFSLRRLVTDRSQRAFDEVRELRHELSPTIRALGEFTTEGKALAEQVRGEVDAIVGTSARVRTKVDDGVMAIQRRLQDLDALYSVVHEEVEDTALSLAATLRTARNSAGFVARIKYLLGRTDEESVDQATGRDRKPKRRAKRRRKRASARREDTT